MEINELYNLAKQYADMIMQNKPEYISENESAVCVIVDGDEQPTTGITTITVKGGQVETIPAETVAVRRFIDSPNGAVAKKMVTLNFRDGSVAGTGKASLMILAQDDPANGDCCVLTSPEEGILLRDIVPVPDRKAAPAASAAPAPEAPAAEPSMMDLMDGFDVDTSSSEAKPAETANSVKTETVGAPAEFSDGFSVDSSNPFFEEAAPNAGVNAANSGVKTMFDHPDDATAQGAAGFSIPPTMQQGYPRQGMQQSGYPQQNMGYPQQGVQSGYPQQNMGYPQQGMQGGYPQQNMGFQQQGMQGGYPQQNMGFQQPMQNGFQGAGTTVRPAGSGVSNMMKMPGVGQTSIQVGDISSRPAVSQSIKSVTTDDLMRKPSFASTSYDDDDDDEEEVPMTLDEMRKLAKQKKKNAKVNSNFKKKMRDSGF